MKYFRTKPQTMIHCPRCKEEHFTAFDKKTKGMFEAKCDKCGVVVPISVLKVMRTGEIQLYPSFGNPAERQIINSI